MHAIQQKCRPKHQVLVLKCYPRTTKGAVDVKPNSSELSYLLFYATSRRSKIQKVGQFLEKKTASDVWRVRIGNVQVTLQILAALIEKSPKDLPLFAQNVLKILGQVLHSDDISMVEASLPTFETFCEHHDVSSLFADQVYLRQYEEVVRAYATFASTRKTPGKGTPSKPVVLRWRNAGLQAIRSIAQSDALSSVAGRQLDVIVPMILENLWTEDSHSLQVLLQRAHMEEKVDSNALSRRRTSVSTVETGDPNPIAISGSSVDMDKMAEENIGVVALQCLKQIFVIPNRAQLHGATMALLKFIEERIQQQEVVMKPRSDKGRDGGWAIKIFELIATWAPVQDRYVIMITATDTLFRTPPTNENIPEQIVLTAIIGFLLRSAINLIGLSVMDVLLGLIQHMQRVLKCAAGSGQGGLSASMEEKASTPDNTQQMTTEQQELLDRLQKCMGDLATHIYYADQISDMISAILLRLKPHSSAANSTPPTEKANNHAVPTASAGNISEEQRSLDTFFALDSAKLTALKAVKSILLVANPKTKISGNVSLTRNKVPIQVWEGTHWLLRDPDGYVRKAYADAVITWLDRETTRADLRARDETNQKSSRIGNREPSASVARRAVSSASQRPVKHVRSHFLQLLHLTIYDSALQFLEYDADILLLHVLLAKLVSKLGVNAARYGIPMVFRLQEDIQEVETPLSKVRLGCLCHGYFWVLCEHFDFETSVAGRAIHNEISRRRSKHFWVEGVHVPPPALDLIGTPGKVRLQTKISSHEVESEALLPFDDRQIMVDCISTSYQEGATSPSVSPAASPGRGMSHPILSYPMSTVPPADASQELPVKYKEEMLVDWTQEAAVMALQAGSKSASLNGSKTGTNTTKGNRLTVNGAFANGHSQSRPGSAYAGHNNLRPGSHAGPVAALRNSSIQSRGSGRSGSSRGFVASVDQLKSVLTGDPIRPPTFRTLREDDDSSESMASYEYTPSELSFNPQAAEGEASLTQTRSKSRERRPSGESGGPLTSHPTEDEEEREQIPPVPPLPASMVGKSPTPVITHDHAIKSSKRIIRSRGGDSILSSGVTDSGGSGNMDLQSMLKRIDTKSRHSASGNLTRPPY
ncbi:Uu.00g114980.m01.CDS01 [Anthostomella pinea]|uniref:Uu.00g114980.m01.CDS01 n=1 Tax=Anthostomella pinea TaxID=933095 RepID=A0AAI8VGU2_9PEZI|nr:Uu.00g114980.m01.CDS01 [Anthostomella pinea]